jgi:hypothetical protein
LNTFLAYAALFFSTANSMSWFFWWRSGEVEKWRSREIRKVESGEVEKQGREKAGKGKSREGEKWGRVGGSLSLGKSGSSRA